MLKKLPILSYELYNVKSISYSKYIATLKMSDEGIEDSRQHDHQQQSDYERLRDQCLSAMNELETLRRRHAEILNRCEMAAQEADYFRKQHKGLYVFYAIVINVL